MALTIRIEPDNSSQIAHVKKLMKRVEAFASEPMIPSVDTALVMTSCYDCEATIWVTQRKEHLGSGRCAECKTKDDERRDDIASHLANALE